MYGCYQYHNRISSETHNERFDAEYGSGRPSTYAQHSSTSNAIKYSTAPQEPNRKVADFWGYVFQIIFQVSLNGPFGCFFFPILSPFFSTFHNIYPSFLSTDERWSCNAYRLCLLVCSCTISDHQRLQFEFCKYELNYTI